MLNRYFTYSLILHSLAIFTLFFWHLIAPQEEVYYGFQFLGGQSGFGSGHLEPAPAPSRRSPGTTDLPTEKLSPSKDPDRMSVPSQSKKTKQGRQTKKGMGQKGGRGESSFGKGDRQGSKTGAVGGVGTSLEIGGFGPGSGGSVGAEFPYKWYGELVYRRLWRAWDRSEANTRQCKVAFVILKDGKVDEIRVKNSSGDAFFDMTARRAVGDAAPFPPLPEGFPEKRLPVIVQFRLQ